MKRFLFEQQLLVRTPFFVDAEDQQEAEMKIRCRMGEPGYPSYDEPKLVVQREEEIES